MIFAALVLFIAITGCGSYHEGVVHEAPRSFLWFTGNTHNTFVLIDNGEPFELKKSYHIDEDTGRKVENKKVTHYQIAPGKHNIIVTKGDQVIVNRVIMIGNGMTKEIQIP